MLLLGLGTHHDRVSHRQYSAEFAFTTGHGLSKSGAACTFFGETPAFAELRQEANTMKRSWKREVAGIGVYMHATLPLLIGFLALSHRPPC